MFSEPFVLLKNYRQQQDESKTSQKKQLIPIQKKLIKKISKSKPLAIEIDKNTQHNHIQSQYHIDPIIQMQQYSDDNINQDQYSPLLFNEFKFTFNDTYYENINVSDEAFWI